VTSSEQQEQEGVPHRRTTTQPQQEGEQQEQEGVATTRTLGTNPTGVTSSEQQEQEGAPHRRTATQPQQEGEQQEQEGVATTGTLGTNPTGVTSSEPPTVLNSIMQRGRLIPCHQKAGTRQPWIPSCGPTSGCLATQTATFAIGVFTKKSPTEKQKLRINQVATKGLSVLIPRFLSSSQEPTVPETATLTHTHSLAVNLGLALWLWYRNRVQPCIAPVLGLKRRKKMATAPATAVCEPSGERGDTARSWWKPHRRLRGHPRRVY
jgi:hypothetical protein